MSISRRDFFKGGMAMAAAAVLGIPEPVAAVALEREKTQKDDLEFVIGGTRQSPEIRVNGIITTMSMEWTQPHVAVSDISGQPVKLMAQGAEMTLTVTQPFTITMTDAYMDSCAR